MAFVSHCHTQAHLTLQRRPDVNIRQCEYHVAVLRTGNVAVGDEFSFCAVDRSALLRLRGCWPLKEYRAQEDDRGIRRLDEHCVW